MELVRCTFWTSSMVHQVPCLSSTLAEILSLCDSYIRVMPDVRCDTADHIMIKRKEQRIAVMIGWKETQDHSALNTWYNLVQCIQRFTLYHELNFVLLSG